MSLRCDIIQLREQGLSHNEIVEELGCAKSTVSYYCGIAQVEKNKNRQTTRRNLSRRVTDALKTETPCMDCGISYPPYIMDFDHRPEEKKNFNIASHGMGRSGEVLLAEIAKCDVVCSNCHRERTWQRKMNK